MALTCKCINRFLTKLLLLRDLDFALGKTKLKKEHASSFSEALEFTTGLMPPGNLFSE